MSEKLYNLLWLSLMEDFTHIKTHSGIKSESFEAKIPNVEVYSLPIPPYLRRATIFFISLGYRTKY